MKNHRKQTLFTGIIFTAIFIIWTVLIQNIDDACLYYELKHYMNEELFEQEPVIMSDLEFKFVPMQEVEDEFIRLFNMLVEEIEENA